MNISQDEAEDIVYGDNIAVQDISNHRWYIKQLVVFRKDDELLGFYYLRPKTEIQEGQDRFENDPVEVYPISSREVTMTIYEVKS